MFDVQERVSNITLHTMGILATQNVYTKQAELGMLWHAQQHESSLRVFSSMQVHV